MFINNKRSMKLLGSFLKTSRLKTGVTQASVASKLKLNSPQYICNIERGLCRPSLRTLKAMSREYKVTRKELNNILNKICKQSIKVWLGSVNR